MRKSTEVERWGAGRRKDVSHKEGDKESVRGARTNLEMRCLGCGDSGVGGP